MTDFSYIPYEHYERGRKDAEKEFKAGRTKPDTFYANAAKSNAYLARLFTYDWLLGYYDRWHQLAPELYEYKRSY